MYPDRDTCDHVWAPFEMVQYNEQKTVHAATWVVRSTRCSKVFCQKCKKIEGITEDKSALSPENGF